MKKVSYLNVNIKEGFWKTKLDMISDTTVMAVYNRFYDTYRFKALDCDWKDGDPYYPHIFWDSDIAKWIEGVSYSLKNKPNKEYERFCDEAIEKICKNADENGYYNSHFLVTEKRFTDRDKHELYCLGHLIEAAVSYYDATGKRALLDQCIKYTDYVIKVFKEEKNAAFVTPGHPELELALVKLYESTGEKRFLDLSKYFIDEHGTNGVDKELYSDCFMNYNQDNMPLRDRSEAEGHCVRALYLFCGMADIAEYYDDIPLREACERVFDNITSKRMYITGATGSTHHGESFTVDYDLPNRDAYAETCASIALACFGNRMLKERPVNKYGDAVERVMYNGILSGVSLDGKGFFYENPLEIDVGFNHVNKCTRSGKRFPITRRKEVFDCSCCPPNVIRFIASVGDYLYTYSDDTVYVHQYINSESVIDGVEISQYTDYPSNGEITFKLRSNTKKTLAVRIPGWCKSFEINREYELKEGYAYISLCGDDEIKLNLVMEARYVRANRKVHENAGRVAVMRGPVVYCLEGVDNGEDIKCVYIDTKEKLSVAEKDFLIPSLNGFGYIEKSSDNLYFEDDEDYAKIPLRFIPYYAFANRGETDMLVWIMKK